MVESPQTKASPLPQSEHEQQSLARSLAIGGVLGALAASSCCVLPLLLFSLGVSGAWIANLTALAPYKPYFTAATVALLGGGFYVAYAKPKRDCTDGSCARPLPNRLVRSGLWTATALVVVALAFDYVAPLLLQ